jgi:phosphoglycolate phosphatase
MKNTNIHSVVFDLDGTLIDSAPGILEGFAVALGELGIVPRAPLDSNLIGAPLAETLVNLSGSSDIDLINQLSERFKKHYDSAGVAATLAFPEVQEMLDRFRAIGAELHICTNKRISVTNAILRNLGWSDRFVSVYALDMVEPRLLGKTQLLSKQLSDQHLDAKKTIYVGDRLEDAHAAVENKLEFHYASWGYGGLSRSQLDSMWNWLEQPSDLIRQAH